VSECICQRGIRVTCPIHGGDFHTFLAEKEQEHRETFEPVASRHFNRLLPEQVEALALLMEECAEVQQVIGKILRHGLYSHHPDGGPNNRTLLIDECGDMLAALEIVEGVGLVSTAHMRIARDGKLQRVGRYLHHVTMPERGSNE
jgi:hypothetical protein